MATVYPGSEVRLYAGASGTGSWLADLSNAINGPVTVTTTSGVYRAKVVGQTGLTADAHSLTMTIDVSLHDTAESKKLLGREECRVFLALTDADWAWAFHATLTGAPGLSLGLEGSGEMSAQFTSAGDNPPLSGAMKTSGSLAATSTSPGILVDTVADTLSTVTASTSTSATKLGVIGNQVTS